MSPVLTNNSLALLSDRASMLAKARAFFAERQVMEVDVPILSRSASVDLNIELIEAKCCDQKAYLHTSPEYGMKRLLADGLGDIFQLSHVFRDGEQGSNHTVEFMMAEWYRLGFTFQEMIDDTIAFIDLFLELKNKTIETFTYRDTFLRFVGYYPSSLVERDELYAFEIEPHFGNQGLTLVTDFPPEQAALAQIGSNGMAERFEIYYKGLELANGYHELLDPHEQRLRFKRANEERRKIGKHVLPIDEEFLAALDRGLPDCCGVAVGFDRLMMLRHGLTEIRHSAPFFL